MLDIGKQVGVKQIYDVVIKENKGKFDNRNPKKQEIWKYKRHESEFIKYKKFKYTHEDIFYR